MLRWIEECLGEEIDPIVQLEESMRNGIVLAQLAHWFAPGTVRRIFTVRASVFRNVAQNAGLLNWQNFVYCRRSDFNSVIPIISTTFSKQSNSYDYQTFSGSN